MRISRFLLPLAVAPICTVSALAATPPATGAKAAPPPTTAVLLKRIEALQAQLATLATDVKAASTAPQTTAKKAATPPATSAVPAKKAAAKVDMQPGWVVSVYPAGKKPVYSVGSYIQQGGTWNLDGYLDKTPWKKAAILYADGFYKVKTGGKYTFIANLNDNDRNNSANCGMRMLVNGATIAKTNGWPPTGGSLTAVGGAVLKPGLYRVSVRIGCNPNEVFYNKIMSAQLLVKAPNNNNPHVIGDSDILHKVTKGGGK